MSLRDALRHRPGETLLAERDTRATPAAPGSKGKTAKAVAEQALELASLQERLYAEGTAPHARRRVLLVLQGMDTSGKGGTIKHVIGEMNPQGVSIAAFKRPTAIELRHNFLWRIRQRVPAPGQIGIFDRSHYEDVLIARVHALAPASVLDGRYAEINRFEQRLADDGVALVKVFLHISAQEQRDRLLARLHDPTKRWKFNPADVAERARWEDYAVAYGLALDRCSTDVAPWYVVPADRKWYRNWAVGRLLLETLEELDPHYPEPELDDAALERALLT